MAGAPIPVAGSVGVWLETNRFRKQDVQSSASLTVAMPIPSDDTTKLTQWAQRVLRRLYRDGYRYVKAGVMLLDLRERHVEQQQLFDGMSSRDGERRRALMKTLDQANAKWGRGTLGVGTAGLVTPRAWTMHRENLSPRYTTRWQELPTVHAQSGQIKSTANAAFDPKRPATSVRSGAAWRS